MKKEVYIYGTGGLGNSLFQLAVAVHYAEKYGYDIRMIFAPPLTIGTSKSFDRNVTVKDDSGREITYDLTIFNNPKLKYVSLLDVGKLDKNFEFNHSEEVIEDVADEHKKIGIKGYCQNYKLYDEVRDKIFSYINLSDSSVIDYVNKKYNLGSVKKNIMIGLRAGSDFEHMKKITSRSYENALRVLTDEGERDYNVVVIADNIDRWRSKLQFDIGGNVVLVDDDDVVQYYVAMQCNNFILCESTFHYWPAYFKYVMDSSTRVVVFNDTDLTNRCIALPEWIRVDY